MSKPQAPSNSTEETGATGVNPYADRPDDKAAQVEQMFDNIAPGYDLMNRVVSMGLDQSWRKAAVKQLAALKPKRVLDLAAGTGDFAGMVAKLLSPKEVVLADFSAEMLALSKPKLEPKYPNVNFSYDKADALNLPYADDHFDALTVGFGIRNFADPLKGLQQMHRVVRPGGRVVILEPGKPRGPIMQLGYWLHFKVLTPVVGALFSKDKSAYSYLPASAAAFPVGDDFVRLAKRAGFDARHLPLTGGACALYVLDKPAAGEPS
ncbi:MAG: bifunctional demethylmenaquinone methyltransferase/2-methoxy-6-polyprenyl-1,4-benzoquinol methylase UbiE [Bacteroidota bacterium]